MKSGEALDTGKLFPSEPPLSGRVRIKKNLLHFVECICQFLVERIKALNLNLLGPERVNLF